MKTSIVPLDQIEIQIQLFRNKRVMLDADLAILYGVPTKRLNEQVQRNIERFPADFMFQLSKNEFENWRSQFATSNLKAKMGLRRKPYVFTQEGVAMLSGVLRSPRAIAVNIEIMRAFIRLRHMLESNKELAKAFSELRSFVFKNANKVDQEFRRVWREFEKLSTPPSANNVPMGFRLN